MKPSPWPLVVLLLALPVRPAPAQQMVDYSTAGEPYLLLLREPAVHEDLRLTDEQAAALESFNEQLDSELLPLRNQPEEQAAPKRRKLIEKSRRFIRQTLTAAQRDRLAQIELRLRGLWCLVHPRVTEDLKLSEEQQKEIETGLAELARQTRALRRRARKGEDAEELQREAGRLQQQQQKRLLDLLSRDQQKRLAPLLGRPFDVSRLGKLRFQAPELAGETWINSKPLDLADLRGKVVALHFYAFG